MPEMTKYPSKEFIEAMLSDTIASLSNALNALQVVALDPDFKSKDGKFTPCRALKGLVAVSMVEAQKVEHCLEPYHEASLNKKHRAARAVNRHFIKEALVDETTKAISEYEDDHDVDSDFLAISFIKDFVEYLSALHTVMHEDTHADTRRS